MTLIRLLRMFALVRKQQALIEAQQALIQEQNYEIRRLHLAYVKELEGIVCGWLIHCDQPELDLRGDLADLSVMLGHRAAALEEYVL